MTEEGSDPAFDQPRLQKSVMPMSSGGAGFMLNGAKPIPPLKPNEHAMISSFPESPLHCDRLLIGGLTRLDWIINKMTVDGAERLDKPIATKDFDDGFGGGTKVLSLAGITVNKEIALDVTYVGGNQEGEHFFCAIICDCERRQNGRSVSLDV